VGLAAVGHLHDLGLYAVHDDSLAGVCLQPFAVGAAGTQHLDLLREVDSFPNQAMRKLNR
jgi:hypothetical protein